jgi:hypothetical protein
MSALQSTLPMSAMSRRSSAISPAMSDESIPTLYQLRGACLLAAALDAPAFDLAEARRAFRALRSDGMVRARDFDPAEALLRSVGLIERDGEEIRTAAELGPLAGSAAGGPSLLLGLLLRRRPPAWLQSAAGGHTFHPELVPDRDLEAIDEVCSTESLREAVLVQAARRQDARELAELSGVGDAFVAESCRHELAEAQAAGLAKSVTLVHQIDPAFDFSVLAPRLDGAPRRLAVKTTRRFAWRGDIFITRAEYEYGLADPSWALVVVEADADGGASILGWCPAADLETKVPGDRHQFGRWDQVRILQAETMLKPGLPSA